MSFADHNILDTLPKTLHSIFCMSSSMGDVDDVADAMSSHRQKICEDVVTFLEYKRELLLWEGRHCLDVIVSGQKGVYQLEADATTT